MSLQYGEKQGGGVASFLVDSLRNLFVTLGNAIAGEDVAANRLLTEYGCRYTNVTGGTDEVVISSAAGYLRGIMVGTPIANATITLQDDGSPIGVIKCDATVLTPFFVEIDTRFNDGLEVTPSSGSLDLTVSWR